MQHRASKCKFCLFPLPSPHRPSTHQPMSPGATNTGKSIVHNFWRQRLLQHIKLNPTRSLVYTLLQPELGMPKILYNMLSILRLQPRTSCLPHLTKAMQKASVCSTDESTCATGAHSQRPMGKQRQLAMSSRPLTHLSSPWDTAALPLGPAESETT